MTISLPEALTLSAAVVYAAGVLLVKRASDLGADVWRTALVANVITALCFQPLLMLGGTWHPELWWQPLIVAASFVAGQWFTFVSIDRGDVSVATPVLGIKILLVAILATLLAGSSLRPQLWAAAALATAGIALLNRRPSGVAPRNIGLTIITAGLAAATFAFFDVLVQKWSPGWGLGHFLPLTLALAGMLSLVYVPRFKAPLSQLPRPAWPWLFGGTLAMGGQSVAFVSTVAHWGVAAQANVIYSSRGLWSVLLVWSFGRFLSSREAELGGHVLAWRLAGAACMMAAIILALL
jgi:uncharacterized membrane protein